MRSKKPVPVTLEDYDYFGKEPYSSIRKLLEMIGDNPDREGLKDTPARIVKSWKQIFSGYKADIPSLFTVFEPGNYNEMVILKDIEFYSNCEHHWQPFFGKAHIAYIPKKHIVGISKLARVLEVFARRLQVQERITNDVTKTLDKYLKPKGSACVIEAKHFCMLCRGVQKQNSTMITSSLTGVFLKPEVRAEFLSFIKG